VCKSTECTCGIVYISDVYKSTECTCGIVYISDVYKSTACTCDIVYISDVYKSTECTCGIVYISDVYKSTECTCGIVYKLDVCKSTECTCGIVYISDVYKSTECTCGVVVLCLYFTVSDHEKLNVFMDDGDEGCFAVMVLQAGFPIRCINIRHLTVVCSTWLQLTKDPCRFGTDPNTFACVCSIKLDYLWLKHNWTIYCHC